MEAQFFFFLVEGAWQKVWWRMRVAVSVRKWRRRCLHALQTKYQNRQRQLVVHVGRNSTMHGGGRDSMGCWRVVVESVHVLLVFMCVMREKEKCSRVCSQRLGRVVAVCPGGSSVLLPEPGRAVVRKTGRQARGVQILIQLRSSRVPPEGLLRKVPGVVVVRNLLGVHLVNVL